MVNQAISSFQKELENLFYQYEFWRTKIIAGLASATLLIFFIVLISKSAINETEKMLLITSITAIYAAVIIIISTIRNSVLFTFTGNILLIIASIKLLFIDTNSPNTYLMFGNSKIFFTTLFVVFLILLVFSIGISIFQHKYKITRTKKIEKHKVFKLISGYNYTVFPSLLIITTSILSFFIIANEIDTQFNYHLDFTFATFYLDVFFPFYFVIFSQVLLFTAHMWLHTYANTRFIYGINAFALMTISFLTLIISGLTQETLNTLGAMGYQTTEFENPTPIINPYFITSILIITTLFITFKLSKIQSWEIDVRYDFWKNIQTFLIKNSLFFRSTLISVFFLWVGSREILVSIDNSGLQQIMLSLYWTIFSVTILSLGILKRKFRVRLISYGLLCIPIIKMFLYDAWLAEPIFGFLGLFLFGCFLLSTAFIYQKNKTRIQEFLTKE
ncbi:MAG: DUF2339 domain-containing protein [SAR202 cluster bacterium]|mgnify:FL=1|nr:DUF2339 domain-containing protein [SAR202 cluster bacterium]|tara:strand:+ start:1298 stop:2632 length:1335 start_codon:yes stop_codon:yes gene_type:complete